MTTFEINENVEIELHVEIEDGKIAFIPRSTEYDWTSYSLETKDGDLIAEHVSYEGLTIHDEENLIAWYKQIHPNDYAEIVRLELDADTAEYAEEKLREVFGSPDTLYEAHITSARKTALEDWIGRENPKIYRDDIRGFGNEFNLTFVTDGGQYTPNNSEYEVSAEDAATMFFMYADDPTTEDYSSATVIQGK